MLPLMGECSHAKRQNEFEAIFQSASGFLHFRCDITLWKLMVWHNVVRVSSLQRCLHCQSWIDAQHRREIFHSSNWACSYGTAYWASAQLRIIIKLIGSWAGSPE